MMYIFNLHALHQDFVDKKKIYQAEKTVQKLKRYDMTQISDTLLAVKEDEDVENEDVFTEPK